MKLLQITIYLVLSYNVIPFTVFNQPQPNFQPPPHPAFQPPPPPEAFTQVESGATIGLETSINLERMFYF